MLLLLYCCNLVSCLHVQRQLEIDVHRQALSYECIWHCPITSTSALVVTLLSQCAAPLMFFCYHCQNTVNHTDVSASNALRDIHSFGASLSDTLLQQLSVQHSQLPKCFALKPVQ
jgi:hypothetical protein